MPHTYYQTLGVSENATDAEIEAAFKSKASEVHPDRVSPSNPYLKNVAAEAFKSLSEARSVLLDAGKRQRYDSELAYSRGSSPNAPPAPDGPTPGDATRSSAAPAGSASRASRTSSRFAWLLNTPSGLIALSVACGGLLLAGGIVLRRASSTVSPPRIAPAANLARDAGPADACKAGATDCTGGSAGPRPAKENESSPAGKKSHATPNTQAKAGDPRSHLQNSAVGKPRANILWRASEPPDLSALSSSEQRAVESACAYSKQMESPDAYHGCLAKELVLRSHKDNHRN